MVAEEDLERQGLLIETIFGGEVKYQRRLKSVIEAYGLQGNEIGGGLRGDVKFSNHKSCDTSKSAEEVDGS